MAAGITRKSKLTIGEVARRVCAAPSAIRFYEEIGLLPPRAIVESARLLSAHEVAERVCAHLGCSHDAHLAILDKAA